MILPLPGFGHLMPLLKLTEILCQSSRITIAVPHHFAQEMMERNLHPERLPNVTVLSRKEGFVDPQTGECGDVDFDIYLERCSVFLASVLGSFVGENMPDIAIVDNFLSHLGVFLHEKGIKVVHFCSASAGMCVKTLEKSASV